MNLSINGRFKTQKTTGVQLYAQQMHSWESTHLGTARWLCPRLEEKLNPDHRESNAGIIQVGPAMLSGHVWEQTVLPVQARGDALFCPCNSGPVILRKGIPLIVTIHCLAFRAVPEAFSKKYRLWYHLMTQMLSRRAAGIITVSKSEAKNIIREYPHAENRIGVIENGVVTEGEWRSLEDSRALRGFRRTVARKTKRIRLLFVGAPTAKKNFGQAVKAVHKLKRMGFHCELKVAGAVPNGMVGHEMKDSAELGISFIGQVNDRELMLNLYREADFLLFPSRFESSGLPPLEAGAAGCIPICSAIPALVERCGGGALYANDGCGLEMADLIDGVLSGKIEIERVLSGAYRRVRGLFWEDCARRTFAWIEARTSDYKRANSI